MPVIVTLPRQPGRPHPASRMEIRTVSRAAVRSSVETASYILRRPLAAARTGERHRPSKSMGLLTEGRAGWRGAPQDLWSATELAERRGDARVARDIIVSLPAELDLEDSGRLLRGYSAWLHDTYGVGVTWALHAPRWHDKEIGRAMWHDRETPEGETALQAAIRHPAITNLNVHAHILFTTRRIETPDASSVTEGARGAPRSATRRSDPDPLATNGRTGKKAPRKPSRRRRDRIVTALSDAEDHAPAAPPRLGGKVRILDDHESGPAEIERLRQEWQRREPRAGAGRRRGAHRHEVVRPSGGGR